jgi:hypothetical protein
MKRPINYAGLERIARTWQPQRLLGRELVWEAKEDGSYLLVWLDEEGELRISSRHMDDASPDFYYKFKNCPEGPKVEQMIRDQLNDYNKKIAVAGEMCRKGKSPTKIVYHERDKFVIFDIIVLPDTYMNYVGKYQLAHQYDTLVVEALATCNMKSLQNLIKFRDEVVEPLVLSKGGIEGAVVKTQYGDRVAAKERVDVPKLEHLPRGDEEGAVVLPPLEEAEIWGAIEKAYADLGHDAFMDVRQAMPLIANYVAEEAKKHMAKRPKNVFKYYQEHCEDLVT